MKALFTIASLSIVTLFAGLAQAEVSTRYKIVAADEATETNLCVVAATEGYKTARKEAAQQGITLRKTANQVTCNGKDIYRFARQYSGKTLTTGMVQAAVSGN